MSKALLLENFQNFQKARRTGRLGRVFLFAFLRKFSKITIL